MWTQSDHHRLFAAFSVLESFGPRFVFHMGESHSTVPAAKVGPRSKSVLSSLYPCTAFSLSQGLLCDVIHIDGSHNENAAHNDIMNMRELASCDHILLVRSAAASPTYGCAALLLVSRHFACSPMTHTSAQIIQPAVRSPPTLAPP